MALIRTGLVIGKFYPPHRGHDGLIEFAQARSERLIVMICGKVTDLIPVELRAEWLRELHPDVDVRVVDDNDMPDDDSAEWAANTLRILGSAPDAVFTSEAYGESYARYLGCRHISADPDRRLVPISGTAVRNDPFSAWDHLSAPVRAWFAIRVGIVGAESTGKTTLAEGLAREFDAEWVPEYGREYTLLQEARFGSADAIKWRTRDFVAIAAEQQRREDAAARRTNRVLICDTDAFATAIWHERYMERRSRAVERIARTCRKQLYLLADVRTPFVQDGIRDGESNRDWMHSRFKAAMSADGRRYATLTGSPERRLAVARDHVRAVLRPPFDYGSKNTKL